MLPSVKTTKNDCKVSAPKFLATHKDPWHRFIRNKVFKKARTIINDLYDQFNLMPSGRCFRLPVCKANRRKLLFFSQKPWDFWTTAQKMSCLLEYIKFMNGLLFLVILGPMLDFLTWFSCVVFLTIFKPYVNELFVSKWTVLHVLFADLQPQKLPLEQWIKCFWTELNFVVTFWVAWNFACVKPNRTRRENANG